MAVTFIPQQYTAHHWVTVDLGRGDSIEIAVSRPTLLEQLRAVEETRGMAWTAYKLASRIQNWRGVNDEHGQPVPYSWDALNQLCAAYDDCVYSLLEAVRNAGQVTENQSKNLPTPPDAGGTDTPSETIPSTESSPSMVDSDGSADSVSISA